MAEILDSGERRQFFDANGNPMAVRDISDDKGRCDLLPLDVVGYYLQNDVLKLIFEFQESGNAGYLYSAIGCADISEPYTLMLEVAKHLPTEQKNTANTIGRRGSTQKIISTAVSGITSNISEVTRMNRTTARSYGICSVAYGRAYINLNSMITL